MRAIDPQSSYQPVGEGIMSTRLISVRYYLRYD